MHDDEVLLPLGMPAEKPRVVEDVPAVGGGGGDVMAFPDGEAQEDVAVEGNMPHQLHPELQQVLPDVHKGLLHRMISPPKPARRWLSAP